jgi:hypothetical protein
MIDVTWQKYLEAVATNRDRSGHASHTDRQADKIIIIHEERNFTAIIWLADWLTHTISVLLIEHSLV